MHLRRLMLALIVLLFLINWTCTIGVVPDKEVVLDVPYHNQECEGYCAAACIQMWAHHDGWLTFQTDIAEYIGAHPQSGAHPMEIERGVGYFTCSEGHFIQKLWDIPGAQGDLISVTISGIECGTPSIMPFYGNHAILIRGHHWREDENNRPIAIRAYFHDPDNGANGSISASLLKYAFEPSPWKYWVVVANPDIESVGISGHNQFILLNGTYYGGPNKYDPKGLTDPSGI
jgi:hypothetical protein